ncbi:jg18284, partial [Pararge aegeria aegeria]
MHREKPGYLPCRICYVYTAEDKLSEHTDTHYIRHVCKMCNKVEYSVKLINQHVRAHLSKPKPSALIQIGDRPESEK